MRFCKYENRNIVGLLEIWASANLGAYKLTGAILIGGVRWHQTFPRWGAFWLSWLIWVGSRILPVPCGSSYRQAVGGPSGWVGWFELVLESYQFPVGPPTVNQLVCCFAVRAVYHNWCSALFQMWACFVVRAVHTAGTSMGTMAASSGACQGVSLWSLKLYGYCATAWWHTVSVCELAACASALFYWRLLKWSLLVSSGKFLFPSSVVPSIGLHLLWDANYCICAAEPYGPMVTWCCMYLSSNWQTWLILPVVICLSQRLSHACLSISFYTAKLRMAH